MFDETEPQPSEIPQIELELDPRGMVLYGRLRDAALSVSDSPNKKPTNIGVSGILAIAATCLANQAALVRSETEPRVDLAAKMGLDLGPALAAAEAFEIAAQAVVEVENNLKATLKGHASEQLSGMATASANILIEMMTNPEAYAKKLAALKEAGFIPDQATD